ncbi:MULTISPECIES: protein translocase subunit SecD [Paenibacillus]|uniref:protein translocase subunit SecD n=1 Tax=Paenibacillus TaxID=44249 RepID=UPI002041EAFB|nr:protein translocase subunit SecD [Paenibacillus camelliae]MCM3632416.1 protein translocase subunit SecD [Paenibacillus camelliae]
MVMKRLLAFSVVVVVLFGAIIWTSPSILKEVKLGLDLKGGFEVLYEASPYDEGGVVTPESLKQTAKALEKRIDESGVAEPEILPEGSNRIRVRLPGVENEEEIREMLAKPINLTFRAPDGTIMLDGRDFKENSAGVAYDNFNRPIVTIELKDGNKLYDVTSALVGQKLAIYLDEEMISDPVVNYPISGTSAQISLGDAKVAEAEYLRDLINMGSLPLKLTEKYTQSVGAKLGLDSMKDTVTAGVIGSVIVLVFMMLVFRIPGFVASISIITYAWLLILVHNWLNATLTLPGIAAFVLGVGMSVDANIITAERIKEEIRSGKSMISSLKAGSKNSFRTIMDANITSIIASIALYVIGDGAIKGFALTMIFSIIVSVITNIYLSRFLLSMLVQSNAFMKPKFYGVKEEDVRAL